MLRCVEVDFRHRGSELTSGLNRVARSVKQPNNRSRSLPSKQLCKPQGIRRIVRKRAIRIRELVEALLDSDAAPVSRGGYAPEALQAAVHFVEHAPRFAVAQAHALDFAGPANYAPVLVGPIAGARWGASSIGPLLLQHAACRAIRVEIDVAGHRLAEGWE
jgi:hypothetical protein